MSSDMGQRAYRHDPWSIPLAICFLAFARPQYFREVVESVRRQCDPANVHPYCFLDGAVNRFSQRRCARPGDIRECARIFQRGFPEGELHASPHNVGIALNYDRAERYLYGEKRYEYVLFLEDDFVLQPHYVRTIRAMIGTFGENPRVGMFNAFGDHTVSCAAQRRNRHSIIPMGHLWAFCMPRGRWIERQRHLAEYLDHVRGIDYMMRSHTWIRNTLYRRWGARAIASSQDGAKTIAMLKAGQVKISTYTNNGHYIGRRGMHWTPDLFAKRGYEKRLHLVFTEPEDRFEAPDTRLDEIEAALRARFLR
jgi:hypothetical protein